MSASLQDGHQKILLPRGRQRRR